MNEKALIRMERKMVIGMIIDTKFLSFIEQIIDTKTTQSNDARTLMTWILDYFHSFGTAPGLKIQDIYEDKLDSGKLQDAQAEVIEEILEDLSTEVEDWDSEDIGYLKEQSIKYVNICKLRYLSESVEDLVDSGDIDDAQQTASEYKPVEFIEVKAVEPLATDDQLNAVFAERQKPIIHYPGTIGQVLNPHMVRQGFVVYLAQNKGGKSFHLMDAGIRGAKQGNKVFMIQAGDMSQIQMERRMAIYNTMNSDQEKFCGLLYLPVIDCAHNQMGTCEMDIRINKDGEAPFEEREENFLEEKVTFALISEAMDNIYGYQPCQECRKSRENFYNFKGAVWYKKRPRIEPLTKASYLNKRTEGLKKFYSSFHGMHNIRLSTHSSDSLTMDKLESELDILADKEKFEPDIIVGDYLDLFGSDREYSHLIFRDQENKKWQHGRRISQDRNLLFLSASQSDAEGFNKKLLDKNNFSEDRRKLDHVTSMIGINMTINEKIMGVSRINEIVSRETEGTAVVQVLHRLQIGRPILGSYF